MSFLLIGSAAGMAGDDGSSEHVSTRHYDVYAHGLTEPELTDLAYLVEAARPHWQRALRAKPDGDIRTTIRVLPDTEAFLERIRLEGGEPPSSERGVWARLDVDTVYVVRDYSIYRTRCRALRGAFLLFHARSDAKNEDLTQSWIVHGLARHLELHHWDGEQLELGVRPLGTQDDMLGWALAAIDPEENDPAEIIDRAWSNGDVGFAIVRFALQGAKKSERRRFEKLALGQTGSKLQPEDCARILGEPRELALRLHGWLEEHQEPLRVQWGDWVPFSAERIEGRVGPGQVGVCFLRQPVRELRAQVSVDAEALSGGGFVFDCADPDDYRTVMLRDDQIELHRSVSGTWKLEASRPLEAGAESIELRIELDDETARISVDGAVLDRIPIASPGTGLVVTDGLVLFDDLRWR